MAQQIIVGRSLPNPRGTSVDYRYVFAGSELSDTEAKGEEAKLLANPKRLSSILLLIGYYGVRRQRQRELFALIVWMINNRPGDYICYYLGHDYSTRALKWSSSKKQLIAEAWHSQVRKHPKDAMVLCNAASFFGYLKNRTVSEKYFKRAKRLDKTVALPARNLAYLYRSCANEAASEERERFVLLALEEADEAFYRRELRGERVSLIQQSTQMAIKFGHLDYAQKFVRRLRPYTGIYEFWDQYFYLYLAWIAMKTGNQTKFEKYLADLGSSFKRNKSHVATSGAGISFLREVLKTKNEELAKKVFTILITGAKKPDAKAELKAWSKAFLSGRKPILNSLKTAYEWPF